MALPNLLPVYERFLDEVVQKMTPEEILAFQATAEEQDYLQELVEQNNEGILPDEGLAHLDQLLEFEMLMSVLKSKALKATD